MAVAGEVRGAEQDDGGEEDGIDLQRETEDRKAVGRRQSQLVVSARKTVSAFEGLLGKSIGFVHGKDPLSYPDKLVVPFDDPNVYELMEHELSHLVFKSDAHMREEFITTYVETLAQAYGDLRVPFSKETALAVLASIVGILDDARVVSLWALRYPGSAARIQSMWRAALEPEFMSRLAVDAGALLYARALGLEVPNYPLVAAADAALARVAGRGYPAVLAATKGYVKDAIIVLGKLNKDASDGDRLTVAKSVLDKVAHEKLPKEDVQPTKDRPSTEVQKAAEVAHEILHIESEDALDDEEVVSSANAVMESMLAKLAASVARPKNENDHVREMAGESLTFARPPQKIPDPMSADDRETAEHLRSLFVRELGRRREILDEYGTSPDLNAWIQRRIAGGADAIFRGQEVARGFVAMLLLDLSSSMRNEEKYASAQRAARIVATALRFPFVDFGVWGYAGKNGIVSITRFSPTDEQFDQKYPGGTTPTHVAIRAARAQLAPKTGTKHLFVVTDGLPLFLRTDGTVLDPAKLIPVVRSEVDQARRAGIQVSSLIIDSRRGASEVSDEQLGVMMGDPRSWRRTYADEFAKTLVELISSTFVRHLRSHA